MLLKRIVLGLLALLGAQMLADAADSNRPNIVFIMADDLGYGDLGCYGQTKIKTPNIDRLAAEGMRFTDYYAGSTVCAPSRCVLMTGLHTGHARIRGNKRVELRPEDVTVAKVLQQGGYRTGMFGKWGLGFEGGSGLPSRQGFETFVGYLDQGHAHNYYPTFLIRNDERFTLSNVVPDAKPSGAGVASEKNQYAPDVIFESLLQFLEANKAQPFFLYVPTTLPHANNEAKQKGMEIPSYGQYADEDWPEPQKGTAAMISRVDDEVGVILQKLKEHGLDENTIVFFTSDNGPHKEGGNDPSFFQSSGPLRGIKRDLYEGGVRAPMIVRWPGRIAPGSVTDHIAYHGDLMATVGELCHVPVAVGLDSVSFAPTLLGNESQQRQHEFLYWEFHERGFKQAIRQGQWKYVVDNGKVELFDLHSDLSEQHDVASAHPDIVKHMASLMETARVPHPEWPTRIDHN